MLILGFCRLNRLICDVIGMKVLDALGLDIRVYIYMLLPPNLNSSVQQFYKLTF